MQMDLLRVVQLSFELDYIRELKYSCIGEFIYSKAILLPDMCGILQIFSDFLAFCVSQAV